MREHAERLSREATLLYFFLAAVADKHGLSFYGDGTLAALLRMSLPALIQARDELLDHDLIAHEARFTQVLSLPPPRAAPSMRARRRADATRRYLSGTGHRVDTPRSRKERAMKIGLWAEICRLAEIEQLSGWVIARRLRCSRYLMTAALELDQPPRCAGSCAPLESLESLQGQDRRPGSQGPGARRCGSMRRRKARTAIPASCHHGSPLSSGPSGPRRRSCLPGSPLRTGPGDAGRLERMRPRANR